MFTYRLGDYAAIVKETTTLTGKRKRDFDFVLDQSGSMSKLFQNKTRFKHATEAILSIPVDTYTVWQFSEGATKMKENKDLKAALEQIEPDGGTNITKALHDILAEKEIRKGKCLLLITDGDDPAFCDILDQPNHSEFKTLKDKLKNYETFVVIGIGMVSDTLLHKIQQLHDCSSSFKVMPGEMTELVTAISKHIDTLTGTQELVIDWGDTVVTKTMPMYSDRATAIIIEKEPIIMDSQEEVPQTPQEPKLFINHEEYLPSTEYYHKDPLTGAIVQFALRSETKAKLDDAFKMLQDVWEPDFENPTYKSAATQIAHCVAALVRDERDGGDRMRTESIRQNTVSMGIDSQEVEDVEVVNKFMSRASTRVHSASETLDTLIDQGI